MPMHRYVVRYCRIPTNFNDDRRATVDAETPELARELVREQLGDRGPGLQNYTVDDGVLHVPVASAGRVLVLDTPPEA